jgi:hypothetical protein
MYLVAIAWMYVVLMMSLAEATSKSGSVLGALFTFALYGALPLSIVMYLLRTPARKRARREAEALAASKASVAEPDDGHHATGDPIAPIRKEP